MIKCPNCNALNQDGCYICGACQFNLANNNLNNQNINDYNQTNNMQNSSISNSFNQVDNTKYKKTNSFKIGDLVIFLLSLVSWFFIPVKVLKFIVAIILFIVAEKAENNKAIFLVLTRIITLLQIISGVVLLIFTLLMQIKSIY